MQIGGTVKQVQAGMGDETEAPGHAAKDMETPEEQAGEDGNVSPEEQAQYAAIVMNAFKLVYQTQGDGKTSVVLAMGAGGAREIIDNMFGQVDPPIQNNAVDNAAAAIAFTALAVDASAHDKGVELSDDALFHAFIQEVGPGIIEDISEGTGQEYDDRMAQGAIYRAVDLFRQTSHRVDPDALTQEFEQIRQADAQGRVRDLLPQLPAEAQEAA